MWPWDWVLAAGNTISGLTQKAVDWINQLIASVMSWVINAVNSVWGALGSVWVDITSVWDRLMSFVGTVATQFWDEIKLLTGEVTSWVAASFEGLLHLIQDGLSWLTAELGALSSFVEGLIADVYRWIQQNVIQPISNAISGVENWVTSLFNRVWQYIQHPELLANLLAGYLLSVWLQLARRFAVPLTKWIIRSMRSLAGEVFDLLEEVISNII